MQNTIGDGYREDGIYKVNVKEEITQNEANELFTSQNSLRYYRRIKNLYVTAVQNGEELFIFLNAVRDGKIQLKNFDAIILEGNRLVSNYCAAIGIFVDQTEGVLSSKYGKDKMDGFRDSCSKLYDNFLEYRFFAILRNYIMHFDMPFSFYSENMDGIKLMFKRNHLLEFSNWKTVKNDIEKMDEEIDITGMIKPMNADLTCLFFNFICYICNDIIGAAEAYSKFRKKYKMKSPIFIEYQSLEEYKNGNMNLHCLDFSAIREAINDIKSNPNINCI